MKHKQQLKTIFLTQRISLKLPLKHTKSRCLFSTFTRYFGLTHYPIILSATAQIGITIAMVSAGMFFTIFALFDSLIFPIYRWQALILDSLQIGMFTGTWCSVFVIYYRRNASLITNKKLWFEGVLKHYE